MGPQNLYPLDELKSLDDQVESVNDLAGLKPIFFRLDEIAKQHANDFEIQLAVGDIKQHLVNRGAKLKQVKQPAPTASTPPPSPMPAMPAAPPPSPASTASLPPPQNAAPVVPPPLTDLPAEPIESLAAGPPDLPQATKPAQPAPPPVSAAPPPAPPPPVPPVSPQGPLATTEYTAPMVPPLPAGTSQRARIPSQPPKPPTNWKRALWIGAIAGVAIAAAGIAVLVNAHKRSLGSGAGNVQVQIATVPPGASVRINGETKCTSDCSISLPPGNYQVTAFLDGYETAASSLSLVAGQPSSISFPLEPQPQSLRILTDFSQGRVQIDGQPPAALQEGEFTLDKILPGTHTVKLSAGSSEASFSFEIADAKLPQLASAVTVRNLSAVLVSSLGNQARVVTNSGPMKLAVNGQPEADTGPAGVDLRNFQSGVDEIVIGEGKDQRSVKESFGPAPMLTAFFKSDVNAGTLIVSTGEDNVRVFLNNKEYPRRTQRGQIRIQTIGNVSVRVIKDGFDSPPPQTAEVKKGAETRLEFRLNPTPKVAILQINGGTPGAEVLIDGRVAGTLSPAGSFTGTSIVPGDHAIELRRDQFVPRRFQRSFKAGQTVVLSGADSTLAAAERLPPPVKQPESVPVKVAPPAPKPGTMADWENNSLWRQENGEWTHRGSGFVAYKLAPKGTFTFTVELLKGGSFFRGGKIRWVLNYVDSRNYALFELDNKNFWAKVVQDGKTFERTKTPLKDMDKDKQFTIQIDVTPEHIVHKMFAGGEWVNLDAWAEAGHNFSAGKFGFLVQGNDEIGVRNFKFQPK